MRNRYELVLLLVPALAVGLSGCGGAGEVRENGGVPVQIEDSAGVRVVEYDGMPEVEAPFQFRRSHSTATALIRATTPSRAYIPAASSRTAAP